MRRSRSSRTPRRAGGEAHPSHVTVFSLTLLVEAAVAATAWGRTAPALRRRREGSFPNLAPSPRLMCVAASFLLFTVLEDSWADLACRGPARPPPALRFYQRSRLGLFRSDDVMGVGSGPRPAIAARGAFFRALCPSVAVREPMGRQFGLRLFVRRNRGAPFDDGFEAQMASENAQQAPQNP